MSQLESIKKQLNYTFNTVMNVLDQAILKIPSNKLGFKPTEVNMSASQLATHVYQMSLMYTLAVEKGEFNAEDLGTVPCDFYNVEAPYYPHDAKTVEEIVVYGYAVNEYIKKALETFTEVDISKNVCFHFDLKLTGFAAMATILEEPIHHRGQLFLYLRMMGIEPPFVYDIAD